MSWGLDRHGWRRSFQMQGLKAVALLGAVSFLFAVPASAAAQETSQSGYSPSDTAVVGPSGGPGPGGPDPSQGADPADAADTTGRTGALPFTGLDAILLVAAGAGLLGLGLAMRWVTREPERA
jgi:surface protein G